MSEARANRNQTASDDFARFAAAIDAGDDEVTEGASFALTADDEAALIALAEQGGEARWWAVRALARIGGVACAPTLADALRAADAPTRAVAALAMGYLATRAPRAVTPLLGDLVALFGDPDGFVRQQAVEGVALCGEIALPVLGAILLDHENQSARVRAAAALRAMRSVAGAPLLFRSLNDANHLVHTYAYEALDDLGLLDNLLLSR